MQKHQLVKARAERHLKIADHMLTQTYPLLGEPKLLVAVMENIFLSLRYSMETLLYYELLYKNIPRFRENFDSKFNMFRYRLRDRHKIDQEHVELIKEVRELIQAHKKSPMEFSRKDKFVICSDHYHMKTIGLEQIKRFIKGARDFFTLVNRKVP